MPTDPTIGAPPATRPSTERQIPLSQPALRRLTALLEAGLINRAPLTLQLLSRFLLHAAAVGAAVGLMSLLFMQGLDLTQHYVLERLAGYHPLRAKGEGEHVSATITAFRPWLLWILPAVGALLGGLLSVLAPETRGGGSDAIIDAFHERGGQVRRRVPFVKILASITTLGFGGSGGREGPTMQIGGSVGSLVGRYLRVPERERRILLVAGTAAGMAAVFRTPLGAALLAVEVLHRDDFESDALVPSVLASVVAYSVSVSFVGESTLFAHAAKYPFIPAHLPLYAIMALVVSAAALAFARSLHGVQHFVQRWRIPAWLQPATGGLMLGLLATPFVYYLGGKLGQGRGLGILGGGYGAAQVAIMGADWLPSRWGGVQVLVAIGLIKLLATSLTVGSGGSAGDFGPSMAMGGIFGGAFGLAAQLVLNDPRIDPGAFALVGMATFYGGLAHVPIGSLVMTCELAGSYDLLVPLMLAVGIAYIALRNESLYYSQVGTKRDSPAHRDELIVDFLKGIRVAEIYVRDRPLAMFARGTSAAEVIRVVAAADFQDAFPVLGPDGELVGVISADILRTTSGDPEIGAFALADDMMEAPTSVCDTDDLHHVLELMIGNGMRELLVTDQHGKVLGVVDQTEITAAYLAATAPPNHAYSA
jgi:CIC family chloride channel protein